MFNRKEIQQNRLTQLQSAVEGNVTGLEKDLETALALTDAGEKFLALKRLDQKTRNALAQIDKNLKSPKNKAENLEVFSGIGSLLVCFGLAIPGAALGITPLLVTGVVMAFGSSYLMGNSMFGEIFLFKHILKKGEAVAKALNPAVNRLKDLQSQTNTVTTHMQKNNSLAICQSTDAFKTLKAEFPDVRNSFAKAIEQNNQQKFSLNTSKPTMLD